MGRPPLLGGASSLFSVDRAIEIVASVSPSCVNTAAKKPASPALKPLANAIAAVVILTTISFSFTMLFPPFNPIPVLLEIVEGMSGIKQLWYFVEQTQRG